MTSNVPFVLGDKAGCTIMVDVVLDLLVLLGHGYHDVHEHRRDVDVMGEAVAVERYRLFVVLRKRQALPQEGYGLVEGEVAS